MDSDEEDDIIVTGLFLSIFSALGYLVDKTKRRRRRWSVRPMFRKREEEGHFNNWFKNVKNFDCDQFFQYTRMSTHHFAELLDLVTPKLIKKTSGCRMKTVSSRFLIGKATVSIIIRETCQALWDTLSPTYLSKPTEAFWEAISSRFREKLGLPNCCGVLDGKHIDIQAPNKSGVAYFNPKKTKSVVIMAVSDADYRFTAVDIGVLDSVNDGGVLANTALGKALEDGTLQLPKDKRLPSSDIPLPYYLVADETFPLKPYIMKPYPVERATNERQIFNRKVSTCKRIIDNAFGVLTSRWKIYNMDIVAEVSTVQKCVSATICLHNFLLTRESGIAPSQRVYCPEGLVDRFETADNIIPGDWRKDCHGSSLERLGRVGSNNQTKATASMRDTLMDYLVERTP